MMYVLMAAWLGAAPARAIENLECEYALATTRELNLVPGRTVSLAPGKVLIRGNLLAFSVRDQPGAVYFGVRDQMVEQRIFRPDRLGLHTLLPGDQIYLLNRERTEVLMHVHFDQLREDKAWLEGEQEHKIEAGAPLLLQERGNLMTRLAEDQVRRLFGAGEPVVMVRSLNAEEFAAARTKYLPSIEAFAAHQNNPERHLKLNDEETFELAHFEVAHAGRFRFGIRTLTTKPVEVADGRTTPALTVYEIVLFALKDDGERVQFTQGDTVFILGAGNKVLLKIALPQERLIVRPPYDGWQGELSRQLLFAERAIIVKRK